ncbi:KilA-N domain-containing protein [Leptolyngbyaceae cyanobacterium UHCC 1019]
MSIIIHQVNSASIQQRPQDGYINLNQMAKAAGKRVDNWLKTKETKDLIAEFEAQQSKLPLIGGSLDSALLTVEGKGGGTWAHPFISIQFAQWCSPAFALQVSRWVFDWANASKQPVTPDPQTTTKVEAMIWQEDVYRSLRHLEDAHGLLKALDLFSGNDQETRYRSTYNAISLNLQFIKHHLTKLGNEYEHIITDHTRH